MFLHIQDWINISQKLHLATIIVCELKLSSSPVPVLEPLNIRPRPKLVLEPPELPSPPPLRPVKPNLPDFPKMKIKFSTCTTLYVPAKPIYENYKKNVQDAAISLPNSNPTHLRYKYIGYNMVHYISFAVSWHRRGDFIFL